MNGIVINVREMVVRGKGLFRFVCFAVFFFLGGALVYAGEYHSPKEKTSAGTTETLICSQCHTMHGTQGNLSMVYDGSTIPPSKLLRHQTIQQLCLFCHDGNQAGLTPVPPDVWGVLASGQTVPSGGNLCSGGSGSPPCFDDTTNHTVGLTDITPPGGSVSLPEFTCINCHNQHGSPNYRNLRGGAGLADTYAGIVFSNIDVSYKFDAVDPDDNSVFVNYWGTGMDRFETSNVRFRASPADSSTKGIQAFCKACHTDFHGRGGSANMGGSTTGDTSLVGDEWIRHPTMDLTMTEGGGNLHVDYTNWQTPLTWRPRFIDPDGIAGDGDDEPFCFTCHRAHGSDRHSALIFGDPLAGVGGGGSMMRDTCQQCHNQ